VCWNWLFAAAIVLLLVYCWLVSVLMSGFISGVISFWIGNLIVLIGCIGFCLIGCLIV
jgi:hypothetical protein